MRIRTVTVTGAGAASAAAIAAAQASTVNVPFTLTGAAASISPPRELTLTASGDLSAVTFAIKGLDRRGNLFTEYVVGPGAASTVKLKSVYSAVISITPNVTSANTASFGLPQRVVSPWFIQDTTRANDNVPTAKVQVLSNTDGSALAAGAVIEMTEQNAARIYGEGAEPETTTLALATVGATVDPRCAWMRVVNTAAAGSVRVAIARPSF